MWSFLLRAVIAAVFSACPVWAEREGSDEAEGALEVQSETFQQPEKGTEFQHRVPLQTAAIDGKKLLLDADVVPPDAGMQLPLKSREVAEEHTTAVDPGTGEKLPREAEKGDMNLQLAGSSLAASVTPAIRALIQSADQQHTFKDALPMNAFVVDDAGRGRASVALGHSSAVGAAAGNAATSAVHLKPHSESAKPPAASAQVREAVAVGQSGTPLLTTVFLAYTLLSFAAVALCAAYITHWESQKACAAPSEREIWSEVLRTGKFGDDPQEPSGQLGLQPTQGLAAAAAVPTKANGTDGSTGAAPWKQMPSKVSREPPKRDSSSPDVDHWAKLLAAGALGVTKAPWAQWQSSLDSFLGFSLSSTLCEADSEDHALHARGTPVGARAEAPVRSTSPSSDCSAEKSHSSPQ